MDGKYPMCACHRYVVTLPALTNPQMFVASQAFGTMGMMNNTDAELTDSKELIGVGVRREGDSPLHAHELSLTPMDHEDPTVLCAGCVRQVELSNARVCTQCHDYFHVVCWRKHRCFVTTPLLKRRIMAGLPPPEDFPTG